MLTWPDTISAVRDSFRTAATGGIMQPAAAQVGMANGSLHLKAGGLLDPALLSVKANLRPDAARALGVILVFDPDQVTLRAVLDSADVTAYRTAATAVVAAGALGAKDGCSVAVLGTGRVAGGVLAAMPHDIAVGAFHVWGRDRDRAERLARTADRPVSIHVHDTPASAAAQADIVVTCTPSRSPLLSAADLREGTLVLAMGADSPGKRELAADVLADAVIVADDLEAVTRVGEVAFHPNASGNAALGELGSVITGAVALPGDAGRTRRVVFDSVGIAFVDTAMAALLLRTAQGRDLGTPFHFAPPPAVTEQ
ncbi:ornithine cyclodeaminase family protein [Streptomyces sp. NPDC002619]|uniref:ornithine cyclodeaminase family protein n=1 Tax=Streptomyces sp. NPDC002619 TaxID=3364655 RepID=UPI00368A6CC9